MPLPSLHLLIVSILIPHSNSREDEPAPDITSTEGVELGGLISRALVRK
jgi:hypothetical protein